MSKHTPGPWTNLPRMQCIPICGQDEAGLSLGFINSSNLERTAEGKANAKLIAAAPDLLGTLVMLRDTLPHVGLQCATRVEMIRRIDAAIFLATGESQ